MAPRKAERIREPEIEAIEYNGENIREVIDYYYINNNNISVETIPIDAETYALGFIQRYGENDAAIPMIKVGDWVVNEDGRKFVVTSQAFRAKYRLTETPEGYRTVDFALKA